MRQTLHEPRRRGIVSEVVRGEVVLHASAPAKRRARPSSSMRKGIGRGWTDGAEGEPEGGGVGVVVTTSRPAAHGSRHACGGRSAPEGQTRREAHAPPPSPAIPLPNFIVLFFLVISQPPAPAPAAASAAGGGLGARAAELVPEGGLLRALAAHKATECCRTPRQRARGGRRGERATHKSCPSDWSKERGRRGGGRGS